MAYLNTRPVDHEATTHSTRRAIGGHLLRPWFTRKPRFRLHSIGGAAMSRQRRAIPRGLRRGITLRMVAPNAVTAMALCFGLTGVRYGISGEWERAVLSILFARGKLFKWSETFWV